MTHTKIEQTRTLSILTEKPHFIRENGNFVAFAGYVFTYSMFSTLFFWSITGNHIYSKIWESDEKNIELTKSLNAHDQTLQNLSAAYLKTYLTNKFKSILKKCNQDEIEYIINQMFLEDNA